MNNFEMRPDFYACRKRMQSVMICASDDHSYVCDGGFSINGAFVDGEPCDGLCCLAILVARRRKTRRRRGEKSWRQSMIDCDGVVLPYGLCCRGHQIPSTTNFDCFYTASDIDRFPSSNVWWGLDLNVPSLN